MPNWLRLCGRFYMSGWALVRQRYIDSGSVPSRNFQRVRGHDKQHGVCSVRTWQVLPFAGSGRTFWRLQSRIFLRWCRYCSAATFSGGRGWALHSWSLLPRGHHVCDRVALPGWDIQQRHACEQQFRLRALLPWNVLRNRRPRFTHRSVRCGLLLRERRHTRRPAQCLHRYCNRCCADMRP